MISAVCRAILAHLDHFGSMISHILRMLTEQIIVEMKVEDSIEMKSLHGQTSSRWNLMVVENIYKVFFDLLLSINNIFTTVTISFCSRSY